MPLPFIPIVIVALLGLTAAVAFMDEVVSWWSTHAHPWLKRHLPTMEPYFAAAFAKVANMSAHAKRMALDAWSRLKAKILSVMVTYQLDRSSNKWMRKVVTYLQKAPTGYPTTTTEDVVQWHQIPDAVRQKLIMEGNGAGQQDMIEDQMALLAS